VTANQLCHLFGATAFKRNDPKTLQAGPGT
jgi:hypothetical protein